MSRINIGKVAPIPKGDWVQSEPYEKLNMVSKSGVLYIAKQDVPADTAITNTDYWMQASEQLSIGTVETVSASTGASATITGGSNGPELNLSIPRGVTGNESIDDTKGKGDTDYVWSADKNYEEINKLYNNKLDATKTNELTDSIVTFEAENDHAIKDLKVEINPIQDLHGLDAPYPAGGGKNKLPLLVSDIKSTNTSGTWSNNTYTINGGTIAILTDNAGNISGIQTSGTFSGTTEFFLYVQESGTFPFASESYTWSGCPTGGGSSTYKLDIIYKTTGSYSALCTDNGNGGTVDLTSIISTLTGIKFRIVIYAGSVSKTFYPMLRLSSVTDATFAPYENICPISGHSTATVTRMGKNLLVNSYGNSKTINEVTFTKNADGSITINGTANGTAFYNFDYGRNIRAWRGLTFTASLLENAVTGIRFDVSVFKESGGTKLVASATTNSTFTMLSDAETTRFYIAVTNGTTVNNVTVYPKLELGSTATAYEAPNIQTVTIDLDGTRYGGVLDVLTGTMTVDRLLQTSRTVTNMYNAGTNRRFRIGLQNIPDVSKLGVCNILEFVFESDRGRAYTCFLSLTNNFYFDLPGTYDTIAKAQTFVDDNDLEFVYYLATPFTVQLTPSQLSTLLGQNNLWANTGDSTITLRLPTGDLAYQDTVNYETEVTNKPDLNEKATAITETASGDITSFTDGSASPVTALSVGIEPVQDLHGYDNPWPAGGGKNLLQVTATTQTINDVVFTVNSDGSVNVNGTASANTEFDLNTFSFVGGTSYILNGCPSGGSTSTYLLSIVGVGYDAGSGYTYSPTENTTKTIRITVFSGNNINKTFYPMIRTSGNATFAPYSNICPISGHTSAVVTRTGKNLFDKNAVEVGRLSMSTGLIELDPIYVVTDFIPVKQGISYYIPATSTGRRWFYDINKTPTTFLNNLGNQVYTAEADGYIRVTICVNGQTGNIDINSYQIELGSSATSYEPYQGTSVTIDLDGTRYGGVLNVLTGEMTLLWKCVTITGEDYVANGSSANSYKLIMSFPEDSMTWTSGTSRSGKLKCSSFKEEYNDLTNAGAVGVHYRVNGSHQVVFSFGHNIPGVNSVSDGVTWMNNNPQQVLYYLATPLTVQLTPSQMQTLFGQNNIWADTGDIEVTYRADTKLYIQKLTQPTEDDMIASTNIEANKFFMVENSLYYSTTAIAAGTSIIPGNNCTKLSLADALNNLNS